MQLNIIFARPSFERLPAQGKPKLLTHVMVKQLGGKELEQQQTKNWKH